jgi:hypothetical protein
VNSHFIGGSPTREDQALRRIPHGWTVSPLASSSNTSCTTDLVGAWTVAVDSRAGCLVLQMGGVRRRRGVFAAKVSFEAAEIAEAFDPRAPASPPVLAPRQYVRSQIAQPGRTTLRMERIWGQGEVDEYHFVIAHRDVTCDLQFNADQTLRSWIGFYPLPRDLRR